ncbi:MAG TPA: iron-containing alcohol dehydrogenase [Solirubrobacterales bacterium]|nr:iron-containing alcohol dehydrogenase [Solirubrobacterales bacterium]
MSADFVWRDAGRTVVCRSGALDSVGALLAEYGFESFTLLSTERALACAPALGEAATAVHLVPPGQVPALAATLLENAAELFDAMRRKALPRSIVAFGGGRVIDTAKAIASVTGARVAAIPTTMSGAEMTAIHRLPAGFEDRVEGTVRPELVLADPEAMTSQPEAQLRASAMNAIGHGSDSLYTPLANPVSDWAALRGAAAIAAALDEGRDGRDRAQLALGSLLCAYALDSAGLGLHHVVCQTLVRVCGSPHAETNAAVLPAAMSFLATRAPALIGPLAAAIGTYPEQLEARLLELGGNPAGLEEIGADRARLNEAIEAMLSRSELARVPGPPLTRADLAALIDLAWQR